MKQKRQPKRPGGERLEPFTPASLRRQIAFWRDELPQKLGIPYNLRQLFLIPDPCPICGGSRLYRSENAAAEIACFCQTQAYHQEKISGWQDYNFLPQRYDQIKADDILRIERGFTPIRRAQFAIALKTIDQFIENPRGNLILVGDISMGRSMLAAYISQKLEPIPNVFISLRQLVDLLAKTISGGDGHVRDIFYRVPVLIIDNFSATYSELDASAAQLLHDLVYYRWSEALPIVLTTNVPLSELSALRGPLLEYLQQDAEVYVFDAKQVQISHASSNPALAHQAQPAPALMPARARCPWLGASDGAAEPVSFPSLGNHCLRAATPQPVAIAHQANACLGEFGVCPIFQLWEDQVVTTLPDGIARKPKQTAPRRERSPMERLVTAIAIIGLVTGAVALGVLLLGERISKAILGQESQPTLTESATSAPTFTSANSGSLASPTEFAAQPPTLELTPIHSATLAPSPSPVYVAQVTLARATNLRTEPNINASVIELLPARAKMNVVGRDVQGIWIRVDTLMGVGGWVYADQAIDQLNMLALPIYVEPTPAPSAAAPDSLVTNETAALTATPGLPESFAIVLQALNISGCNYPDLTSEYEFRVIENRITINRPIDSAVLTGTYERDSGVFHVSATYATASETIDGKLTSDGRTIDISAEQNLTYFGGACAARYSVSGRLNLAGLP